MLNDSSYGPSVHLSWREVAVDDPECQAVLSVRLKASKTDPFRKGITLYMGKVSSDLCPVAAILSYLLCRGSSAGPLFWFKDGRPSTRQRFMTAVRDALREAGMDAEKYTGHSFRIDAATTAASKGLEDYHSNIGPLEELGISGVHPHPKTTAGKLLSSAVLMLPAPTNGCIVAGHYSYSVCTLLVPPFVCHYVFLLHCISFEILSVLR